MGEAIPSKLCGRPFDGSDLERIRREIVVASPPLRSEIARGVCRALAWSDALGRPKPMSARVGLLRLHRAGLIERYRYLGYTPLPGAQLRYLIHCDQAVLGAIGFGAAAWKVAARDRWIGWEAPTRETHLGRVLNNARFPILPWIQVKNLASKALAVAANFRAALGVAA